jgi:hypothetical protein
MEAAPATISLLGFRLDLMPLEGLDVHVRRREAQSGGASAWTAGAGERMEVKCESEAVARLWESDGGGSVSDGRKKKGEWGQPQPGPPNL